MFQKHVPCPIPSGMLTPVCPQKKSIKALTSVQISSTVYDIRRQLFKNTHPRYQHPLNAQFLVLSASMNTDEYFDWMMKLHSDHVIYYTGRNPHKDLFGVYGVMDALFSAVWSDYKTHHRSGSISEFLFLTAEHMWYNAAVQSTPCISKF